MKDEIKEILDKILLNCDTQEEKNKLLDYITNLQEEKIQLEGKIKQLEHNCKQASDSCRQHRLASKNHIRRLERREQQINIYKSRNEKAINEVIRVLQIILEQPSKDKLDDLWIINRLEGIQILLQGEDKDDTNSR